MEKEMKDEWARTVDLLMSLDEDGRKHFALLLVNLAKCYDTRSGWKALTLISTNSSLLTFSSGADEFEAAGMLEAASEVVNAAATYGSPGKGMMN